MIKDVTDLNVYTDSLELLKRLYVFLKKVPKTEYDTVLQCKKCSKSIPANIAEGFAKRSSVAEFKRFLKIAIGSAVPYLTKEGETLSSDYKILSRRLNKLHSSWMS